MTEQKQPEALRLIAEWRNSMPIGVMRIWAADVRDELRRQHAEIESLRAKLEARAADIFGDAPQPSQEPPPLKPMCCRCLDESDDLLPANCSEKPELLTGAPLGMYHCPDCGAMVCAGFPHGPLCQTCHDRARSKT